MIYSVFNQVAKAFDYYEAPSSAAAHAGSPDHVTQSSPIGATPEQAGWPLPAGARKVGTGEVAKGRIASLGTTDASTFHIRLDWMLVGAAIYYFWSKR